MKNAIHSPSKIEIDSEEIRTFLAKRPLKTGTHAYWVLQELGELERVNGRPVNLEWWTKLAAQLPSIGRDYAIPGLDVMTGDDISMFRTWNVDDHLDTVNGGLIGDGPDQWRATTTSCFSFERVGPCQAIAELQVGKSVHVHDSATMASTHPSIQIRVAILPNRLELIGKRAPPKTGTYTNLLQNPSSQTFLLFPTNGVGFGHFTRMYALAARLKEDPDVVCIFFTTMPVLHVLYQERFITYHISGRKRLDGFEAREWNTIVEEMLRIVIEAHNPTTFVFDGAFPYRGMLEAIGDYGNLRKIWVRRGTMKARSSIPVDSEDFFERSLSRVMLRMVNQQRQVVN